MTKGIKTKYRVCRICGRGTSSDVRRKTCRCGGKLVSNLDASIEAMLERVVEERESTGQPIPLESEPS